jgi:hypothetical protein
MKSQGEAQRRADSVPMGIDESLWVVDGAGNWDRLHNCNRNL